MKYKGAAKMKGLKITSALLSLSLGLSVFAGCAKRDTSDREERDDIEVESEASVNYEAYADMTVARQIRDLTDEEYQNFRSAYMKFTFNLLNKCLEQDGQDTNVMVSPASVMLALDMTASGARGETLAQMAGLYGGLDDPQGQLSYAAALMDRINSTEGVSLHAANSIWINDDRIPEGLTPEFMSFVEDNFDAESDTLIFDQAACDRINGWVDEKTDGMIPTIVDELDPEMALMLINAIAFDGEWADQYDDSQVRRETFTAADGTEQTVQMMHSGEEIYYENDIATGFAKYYSGGEYAFIVMLPKDEDQNAGEMLAQFDGDSFIEFLDSGTREYDVVTAMPEFSYDWGKSIRQQLMAMGMEIPFSREADFGEMAELENGDNLYIGDVVHKTHIDVDRNGTRAAAVTAVMVFRNEAIAAPKETKEVICDRSFAYAIVDMTNSTPVFIGTVNSVEG